MTPTSLLGPSSKIRNNPLYHRLKASLIYDLYWHVRDRAIIDERDSEVDFYRALLTGMRPGALIFDIGANQGYKVDIFLRLGARVIAVDPDDTNQAILRRRYHTLRWKSKPVTIVGKAVSNAAGVTSFLIDEPGSAKNTLSRKWASTLQLDDRRFGAALAFAGERKVETVTLAELAAEHGDPFFVKIDVEGHELDVLQGLHRPVPLLSFEVNLPDFLDEGIECNKRLEQLHRVSAFNFAGPKIGAGLMLASWVGAAQMIQELRDCKLHSVEIFCRTM